MTTVCLFPHDHSQQISVKVAWYFVWKHWTKHSVGKPCRQGHHYQCFSPSNIGSLFFHKNLICQGVNLVGLCGFVWGFFAKFWLKGNNMLRFEWYSWGFQTWRCTKEGRPVWTLILSALSTWLLWPLLLSLLLPRARKLSSEAGIWAGQTWLTLLGPKSHQLSPKLTFLGSCMFVILILMCKVKTNVFVVLTIL